MNTTPPRSAGVSLDVAVRAARRAAAKRGLPAPLSLLLLGTGRGLLAERLAGAREVPLGELEGTPPEWAAARLASGELEGHPVWMLEDLSTDPAAESAESELAPARGAGWRAGFPLWLAAEAGAKVVLHASAGVGLAAGGPYRLGTFAFASDHINLSGTTPLIGLAESTLGPLFPDLSRLHHAELRRAAGRRAAALGLVARDAVVACTSGPAIETPAERRFLARAGADVAVQGLAAPLLAAAHAGLRALCVIAIADQGPGPTRLRDVVMAAGPAEAALEDLIVAVAPDLESAARAAADAL